MVLIKFLDIADPNAFVIKLFDHLVTEIKKPRTRYSNRVLPIEKTTFVSEDSITSSISPGIQRVFRDENESKRPFKFCVELRARNNDKLNKDDLKRRLVTEVGKGHFVDLKTPHKILLVEIFAKAAGVAVVDAEIMAKYKGFNIRSVSDTFGEPLPPHPDEQQPKKPKAPKSSASAPKPSEDSAPSDSAITDVTDAVDDQEEQPETAVGDTSEIPAEDSDSDSDNGGISIF
jgi:tRNA(Ser,Leu) C12 N-acetylase TAN1